MKLVDKKEIDIFKVKINYYPKISIKENNEKSLFYVHKENYNLDDMNDLFIYLRDAEDNYDKSDEYYVFDGKEYSCEYDEDYYIDYHFHNIPEKFLNDDEFLIKFFNENDTYFDRGNNIFNSNCNFEFNVKNIDTVITILKNINWDYSKIFKYFKLNEIPLIDVLNEYNEEDYIYLCSISDDFIDDDLIFGLLNKYKVNKLKEKLENNLVIKNTTEKSSKI